MAGDDFIRRAAAQALHQKGGTQLNVSAPFNDLQLLGIMGAILAAANPERPAEEVIAGAVNLLGHAAGAIKRGEIVAAMRMHTQETVPPA